MKSLLTLLAVCTLVAGQAQDDATRVLFLGNSYTNSNNLPNLVQELSESLGYDVEVDSNTPGGYTLNQHGTNATSLAKIQEGDWDFVILQEQSQLPSFPDFQVEADFFPAVTYLVDQINTYNDCAIPMLYMTWGRENGDQDNCVNWPPVCTYEGMQELLSERYLDAAEMNDIWCAPVGTIWEDVFTAPDNTVELYSADGSHPALAGSYLAAATMVTAMFGDDPSTSDYTGGLDAADAETIDEAVWNVWNNEPEAFSQNPLLDVELTFTDGPFGTTIEVSTSHYVDSVVVDYGAGINAIWEDGDTNVLLATETTYFNMAAYSSCTNVEFFLDSLVIEDNVGVDEAFLKGWNVYPNPADEVLTITQDVLQEGTALLRAMHGSVVRQATLTGPSFRWEVGDVPSGVYVLEVVTNGQAIPVGRVLIQH